MDLREQRFGIEIEFTGITRKKAAQVLADYFGTAYEFVGGVYDKYEVKDDKNRKWKIMSDGSITCEKKLNGRIITAPQTYSVEFVSPICKYEDIPKIQEMVRSIREKGALVNSSCGIHVHIDASKHDVRSLRNIVNIMAAKEDIFYKALDIKRARENYCKKVDKSFLEKLNKKIPRTKEQISNLWYNGTSRGHYHYDETRYHALNLHSVFQKGTVEFRMFNSTLHAGKVKTYIQFSLAISAQAINQHKASAIKTITENEKYTFRTWLLRLGMIGDEFATARKFLLENLDGCIAWRDPSQLEAQKERMRQSEAQNEVIAENSEEIQEQELTMNM